MMKLSMMKLSKPVSPRRAAAQHPIQAGSSSDAGPFRGHSDLRARHHTRHSECSRAGRVTAVTELTYRIASPDLHIRNKEKLLDAA